MIDESIVLTYYFYENNNDGYLYSHDKDKSFRFKDDILEERINGKWKISNFEDFIRMAKI
jgi:hypothetical protein